MGNPIDPIAGAALRRAQQQTGGAGGGTGVSDGTTPSFNAPGFGNQAWYSDGVPSDFTGSHQTAIQAALSRLGGRQSQQQGAQVAQQTQLLQDDFNALAQGDYESIRSFETLAEAAIRLYHSPDPELNEYSKAIFAQLSDNPKFRDVIKAISPERPFEQYLPEVGPGGGGGLLTRGFGKVLETINKTSQFGLGLTADLARGKLKSAASRIARGGVGAASFASTAFDPTEVAENVIKAATGKDLPTISEGVLALPKAATRKLDDPIDWSQLIDTDQSGTVGFREALGLPADFGEDTKVLPWTKLSAGHLMEFGGQVATDPLTYVTLGSGGFAGKGAAKGVAALDQFIATTAIRNADEAARASRILVGLRNGMTWRQIAQNGDDDFLKEVLVRVAKEGTRNTRDFFTEELTTAQLRAATKMARQTRERAGGGIFFAGQPIPGSRALSGRFKQALRAGDTPLLDRYALSTSGSAVRAKAGRLSTFKRTVRLSDRFRKGFIPGSRIADRFGKETAKQIRQKQTAVLTRLHSDLGDRLQSLHSKIDDAIRETMEITGLSKEDAQRELFEAIDNFRVRSGKVAKSNKENVGSRRAALNSMELASYPSRKSLIQAIDRYSLELKRLYIDLGYDEQKLGNAFQYTPRVANPETRDQLAKWINSGGIENQILQSLRHGDLDNDTIQYLKELGLDGSFEDIGIVSELLQAHFPDGKSLRGALDDLGVSVQRESERLGLVPIGTKARTLARHEKSVAKANEIITEVARKQAEKMGIEDFAFDDFYTISPEVAWGETFTRTTKVRMTHEVLEDLQDMTLSDFATGVSRPAAVKLLKTTSKDGKTKLVAYGDNINNEVVSDLVQSPNYRPIAIGDNVEWYVDKDIYDELLDFVARVHNEDIGGQVASFFNKWSTIWATNATIPIWNLAFHSRNAVGNWFNMIIGGVKNPVVLERASVLQAKMGPLRKLVQASGDSWDDVLKRSVDAGDISKTDARIILQARDTGVLDTAFFSDLSTDIDFYSDRFTRIALDTPIVNRGGRKLGKTIENNARLATFIDGLNKGMSANNAALRTKQLLFDYADLTQFERRSVRSISRFYTWMRKNTPLQLRMIATHPGATINTQRAVDRVTAGIVGGDSEPGARLPWGGNPLIPDWAQSAGYIFGQGQVARVETPLISAYETLERLTALATVVPTTDYLLPEAMQTRSLRDRLHKSLSLFASGPGTALTNVYEEISHTDMFTGGPLQDGNYASIMRWVESLLPSVPNTIKRLERLEVPGTVIGEGLTTEHQRDLSGLKLMDAILGIDVYELNEEQQSRAFGFLSRNVSDRLQEAKDAGLEVPTITELIDAGKISGMNAIVRALYFSENSEDALSNILPDDLFDRIRAEGGLDPREIRDATELSVGEKHEKAQQYVAVAEQILGRPLTELERQEFVLKTIGDVLPDSVYNEIALELGLEPEVLEPREKSLEQMQIDHQNYRQAVETALGRQLSNTEATALLLMLPDTLKNDEWERLGIEPFRNYGERIAGRLGTDEPDSSPADIEAMLRPLAQVWGLTPEMIRQIAPMVAWAERDYRGGKELGMSDQEIAQMMVEELGRRRRALLFGVDSLEVYDYEKSPTPEELANLSEKAWQDANQFMVIARLFGMREISYDDIFQYAVYNRLLIGEQETLGIPRGPRVPNRKDPRSRGQYTSDASSKLDAVLAGLAATGTAGPVFNTPSPDYDQRGPFSD